MYLNCICNYCTITMFITQISIRFDYIVHNRYWYTHIHTLCCVFFVLIFLSIHCGYKSFNQDFYYWMEQKWKEKKMIKYTCELGRGNLQVKCLLDGFWPVNWRSLWTILKNIIELRYLRWTYYSNRDHSIKNAW